MQRDIPDLDDWWRQITAVHVCPSCEGTSGVSRALWADFRDGSQAGAPVMVVGQWGVAECMRRGVELFSVPYRLCFICALGKQDDASGAVAAPSPVTLTRNPWDVVTLFPDTIRYFPGSPGPKE